LERKADAINIMPVILVESGHSLVPATCSAWFTATVTRKKVAGSLQGRVAVIAVGVLLQNVGGDLLNVLVQPQSINGHC
jgi:hypothetical protein